MAWIESHQSLLDHPKTRKASRLLGIPRVHLVGHLHALWWWAIDAAEDGDISRFTVDDIELIVEWDGAAGAFVDALVNCGIGGSGFLDRDGDRLLIHDWDTYAGKLIGRRKADRERKASSRRSADVQRTSDGQATDGARSPYVTVTVTDTVTDTEPGETTSLAPAKPSRKAAPKVERSRNETWDALAALCGEPETASERGDFGKTVKELDEARASPAEIAAFGPWWWQHHPDAQLTHRCLRQHFGRFRNQPERPFQPSDIKNPMVRAALTADLSDIEAELREKATNGRTPRQISGPFSGPRELPADARRLGAGERTEGRDVLPAPRRERRA